MCATVSEQAVAATFQHRVDELIADPDIQPPINEPMDIILTYNRKIVEQVYTDLGCPDNVRVLHQSQETLGGLSHHWLKCNGTHFDAERPEGVDDYTDFPQFERGWSTDSPPTDITNTIDPDTTPDDKTETALLAPGETVRVGPYRLTHRDDTDATGDVYEFSTTALTVEFTAVTKTDAGVFEFGGDSLTVTTNQLPTTITDHLDAIADHTAALCP